MPASFRNLGRLHECSFCLKLWPISSEHPLQPVQSTVASSSLKITLQTTILFIVLTLIWNYFHLLLSSSSYSPFIRMEMGPFWAAYLLYPELRTVLTTWQVLIKYIWRKRKEVFLLWMNKEQKRKGTIHNKMCLIKKFRLLCLRMFICTVYSNSLSCICFTNSRYLVPRT